MEENERDEESYVYCDHSEGDNHRSEREGVAESHIVAMGKARPQMAGDARPPDYAIIGLTESIQHGEL